MKLANGFDGIDARFVGDVDGKTVSEKLGSLSTSNALKADKTYVDTQLSVVNAGPKGTYATLTDLQTAFPTGNNNIYVVTADGKWYYWNGSAWTAGAIYQSTGIASKSVDTGHLSDNVVNQLGYPLTNFVTNGNFANTTGWTAQGSTISAASNKLTVTSNGQFALARVYGSGVNKNIPVVTGNKIYARAKVKVTNSVCSAIRLRIADATYNYYGIASILTPLANQEYEISGVFTGNTTLNGLTCNLLVDQEYADTATSNGKVMEVQYLLGIDLTAMYGAGLEPTKEEMDELLSKYSNSWFDGAKISVYSVKELKKEMDLIGQTDITYKLNGKTLLNFGDSIARGNEIGDISYATIIADTYSMTYIRKANGAASMSSLNEFNNVTRQVNEAIAAGYNPDVILLEGGTNDIAFNYAIGTMTANNVFSGTFDTTTFSGALEYCLFKLRTTYIGKKIVFIRVHNMSSRDRDKQISFGNRAIEICEKWSVPVVDLYKNSNLNTNITGYSSAYTFNNDATHPTQEAYNKFYVPMITARLNEIM